MDQQVPQQSPYNLMSAASQVPLPYQQQPAGIPGPVAGGYPPQVRLPQNMTFQQQQLYNFWSQQMQEIEQVNDFKNHQLPLARIKKIMKADEDVRMISAEAPVLFAKACELFILELTLRSWIHTEENKRRTLQRNDIAAAITRTDIFDFLVDIVPRDELKEEGLGVARGNLPLGTPADHALPYGGMYYMPQPQPDLASPVSQQSGQGMVGIPVGRPAGQVDPAMYMPLQHQRPGGMPYFAQQQVWQPQPEAPDTTGGAQPPASG